MCLFCLCHSGLASSTMSENFSRPYWELLPLELLEKIFSFMPKHLLNNIGLVCSRWKDAVHYSAVKLLISCISAGQLEEKQIERFGWRTSAAWDHDSEKCSCINLAFNFFNRKSSVLVQGISRECLGEGFLKLPTTMSDKVIYVVVDNESKVSLRAIDRLDAGSQPQVLELPTEQENGNIFYTCFTQIVACDNLLAVLFRKTSGIPKVFLWNRESETWLADLDITHLIPNCRWLFFTISRNLLAVTVENDGACSKSFFWRLDTRHPDASLPQFLGYVTKCPGNDVFSVTMNDKWIVLWCSDGILTIEKTRLFCVDQNQVAVEAQQVKPELLQNPWQLLKLHDMNFDSVTLEPGSLNRLGILHYYKTIFQILNLATGETVCRVSLGSNLYPVRWFAGSFLFIKVLQPTSGNERRLQLVVFDPSRSRGSNFVAELEGEEACLLSGPTYSFSGAPGTSDDDLSYTNQMIHMDYFGLVFAAPPTLLIASFD
jgi:hypothetical protein